MKKIMNYVYHRATLAVAVLLFLGSIQVRGSGLPDFRIINAGLGQQFAVKVAGLEQGKAEFQVKNQRGKVLLSQAIKGTEYQGIYSLEGMTEGNYTFVLRTSSTEISQPIRLTRRAVLYDLEARTVVHFPEVVLNGRQLDVNFLNPSQEEVTLVLRDESGHILYEQTFTGVPDIEKRINLLQIPVGVYFLEMKTPLFHWQEDISLN